ncbi:MAG: hypothetical protein J6581_05030 [Apibacter sp.]|nr:hypothetical protein [Apibacter sp.]
MGTLQKINFFKLLPVNIRKTIFKSSNKGDQTLFDIIVKKRDNKIEKISLQSINGQGELTVFSTILHIEKLFSKPTGIYFSHQLYNNEELIEQLKQNSSIKIIKQ